MSDKTRLRGQRAGTVINNTSKKQEKEVIAALKEVQERLLRAFPSVKLRHEPLILLKDVVDHLRESFPDEDFFYRLATSFMRPDGGILYIVDSKGKTYPILVSEVKNQGTNDLRAQEGKPRQAQGNAIERLGKNVIGFRTFLLPEGIFPFVCFGYGCDFDEDSSILDRVITIAMFGKLNTVYLHNEGCFNRGSFFFRKKKWGIEEMVRVMYEIAEKSIYYYFSKYGKEAFGAL